MKLWRSFRVRLAVFATLGISMVILGFGGLVDFRLRRSLEREQESRLRLLASQLPPLARGQRGVERRLETLGAGMDWEQDWRQSRFLVGFLDNEGTWWPFMGDWPKTLEEHLAQGGEWPETATSLRREFVLEVPENAPWGRPGPPLGPGPGVGVTPRADLSFQGAPGDFRREGRPAREGPGLGRLTARELREMQFFRFSVAGDDGVWRIGGLHFRDGVLWLAWDAQGEERAVRAFRRIWLIVTPFCLLAVVVLSWTIATRALRPVRELGEAMGRVSERSLGVRLLSEAMDTEFAPLVDRFNAMLERLERSFAQAQRFSADAAHELKTPLTILQGELEAAVVRAEGDTEQQAQFVSLLDEIGRLRRISERLLQLAKADSGRLLEDASEVALSALLEEEVELTRELAEGLEVHFEGDVCEGASLRGDAALLRQAIRNLLGNAVKYNRPGGWIRIGETVDEATWRLSVANTGEPIPPERQERIFDRFTRGDAARNRRIDGLGLGLSLAREIAHAHGGSLVLETSTEVDTHFVLTLPLSPESS